MFSETEGEGTLKVLFLLLVVLWNADVAFSVEFRFSTKTYEGWEVCNYNEGLRFEIKGDNKTSQEYLRITREEYFLHGLTQGKRVDTAFKLVSPLIEVIPDKVYCLKVRKRSSFDIPSSTVNKGWNHIIWYDMYGEEVAKTYLNGMGKSGESPSYFVDTGLVASPEAEKARIVLGFDWPDFSENDFLDIFEVKFEEYENRLFDFEEDGESGWEIKFNHQNHLVMGVCNNGANGSKHCYRVERNLTGKADTAFRLASPYIPVKPDSYHVFSFEERHNYDFSRVTKGYCQILWYDARRNLIGKSDMGSLQKPHLEWFLWMRPFFRSPKGARLARIEYGNDWPDFTYGDFWELDDVVLRGY
jgi:hypothetical protein